MNEQLTLQSTQHEETKTVPLRRRKACLAGTFALFAACALVLLIPHPAYAGIIGDFLDIPNMIKTWLLQIAATLFNTYFGVINQTLDAKFISGPFNELFGTTEPYGVVKDFYQAGVIPVAHAILVGKCPRCGKDVIKTGSIYACSSIKNEKQEDGTWKEVAGCGFKLFGFCTKKFTEKQAASLLDGKAVSLRGCKSKAGKTFDCTVVLQKDGSVEPIFTPRKPTKKGRR